VVPVACCSAARAVDRPQLDELIEDEERRIRDTEREIAKREQLIQILDRTDAGYLQTRGEL